MDIGNRLKAVRTKAALSQRELAKRSGVTNGFISQIEKNQVSPSVSSLRKVLEGIPMSLASFFTEETEMGSEVVFRAADMPDLGSHPISYRLVGHSRANRAIGMLKEVLPPGADTGDDMLSHDGEECGIVITGCAEVTVGEQVYLLQPGDGYYFDSRTPHRFRNPGQDECVLISANTPATF
ncbi:cupin domain-containing protein [Aeromonas simiae]|uniref:cupin domain-containing protein n=1 Tax=Aeromonas simiae TaxID=218936 RepID=UPI00266B5E13|nr:cupin domain-containing protein [Aeromonas simiae]MDO2949591.1 cupin domain-containing protein [Aeromonas simiae]MDO2953231.1 cupin domain-containing protein [Aeromonas simiae]MDO2956922.1 cupin domain-containing protein [Aeromonas simiae]